jgi:general secretion pathway protein F
MQLSLAPSTPLAPLRPAGAAEEEQFAHDLALMLRAGLRLLEALQAQHDRDGASVRRALPGLQAALQQGLPFSRALADTGLFSTGLVACVRASEATGNLADSLERFAINARRLREWRSRLLSASVYPLLLTAVAAVVVLFLLMYVVPRFALVLDGVGQDMPAASRALIAVGLALSAVQGPVLLALALAGAAAAAWLWHALRTGRLGRWLMDRLAALPGVGPYVHAYGLTQLARSSGMLVRAGIPVLKALAMCRDLLPTRDRARLDQALHVAQSGAPLPQALRDAALFDELSFRVLKVAQQTGQLDVALDRVAELHEDALGRALDRLSRLVEPLLMLGIGTVVGGIVVLMYMPIFQLAASIR